MTEINNKYGQYRNLADNVGFHGKSKAKDVSSDVKPVQEECERVPDTGVLGRSQVRVSAKKGGNIEASVKEAVDGIKMQPAIVLTADAICEEAYREFLDHGLNPLDSYMAALELTGRLFGED